jgi:hypothetical protein
MNNEATNMTPDQYRALDRKFTRLADRVCESLVASALGDSAAIQAARGRMHDAWEAFDCELERVAARRAKADTADDTQATAWGSFTIREDGTTPVPVPSAAPPMDKAFIRRMLGPEPGRDS